ncbi:MAG: sensor histidine kinase [Blastocatellia bacterium]
MFNVQARELIKELLEGDRNDEGERLERRQRLMKDLGVDSQLADQIEAALLDEISCRSEFDRSWLKRALPLIVECFIHRHLSDFSQELQARRREESVRGLAYHDVQLQLQAALAQAENHAEELKDPTAKSWSLRESAEELVTTIELAGAVLQNLMQGEYLPEDYLFEQLDLRRIVRSAISLAQPMAERKNITIRPHLAPENMPIMLQVSPIHLQQAFNNLIHNAVKYSYRGGEYGGRQVGIRGSYAEQGYRIVIENHGIGILEEEYDLIFEPGYKGLLRQKERLTGSGLGLPLTRQIIEKHKGKIGVCSEPAGEPARDQTHPYLTRFTVWLPLTQPGQAGPAIRLVKG